MSSEAISRSRPVRLGVVGAGLVAQAAHLPLLRVQEDLFALAGLADPDAATRERVAARFGIACTAPTQRELLERAELDAVLIASPNGAHAEQVLEALAAGLHVLVEKPLCLSREDAARIVAARDRGARVVQVGYMKRHDPAVEALLADLGGAEVLHVESLTHDPGLRARFSPDRGGPAAASAARPAPAATRRATWWSDVFAGALVHDVNLVHGVLDRTGTPPVRVADAFAGDDRAGGTLELRGGARWTAAWLALPAVADFSQRVTVYCADGIRRLEFPAPYLLGSPTVYSRAGARDGVHEVRVRTSWDEAYDRQLRHFRTCIAGELPCRTPPEQAERDLALLAELFDAATAGEPATVAA
jgi:predicted dehydrogenase